MKDTVFNRPLASLVEFYNSYCGACQRFAMTYKEFAKNITKWNGVAQVCAIDCASDLNNDVCRQYEVMRYPTVRYFPPNYAFGNKHLGTHFEHSLVPNVENLTDELTRHIMNETNGESDWPKFDKFSGNQWNDIFDEIPLDTKYVYVVSDQLPGYLPQQVLLDNIAEEQISVKIIDSSSNLSKVR
jgi:thiol oxidase